ICNAADLGHTSSVTSASVCKLEIAPPRPFDTVPTMAHASSLHVRAGERIAEHHLLGDARGGQGETDGQAHGIVHPCACLRRLATVGAVTGRVAAARASEPALGRVVGGRGRTRGKHSARVRAHTGSDAGRPHGCRWAGGAPPYRTLGASFRPTGLRLPRIPEY